MKKIIFKKNGLIFLVFILLASFASAQTLEEIMADLGVLEGLNMPQPFKTLYGNERINVYYFNNSLLGSVATQEGVLKSPSNQEIADATMHLYVKDGSIIENIIQSPNKKDEFFAQKKAGNIRIEGQSFGKKFKLWWSLLIGRLF